MKKLNRILAATDFSERALRGVMRAALLSADPGCSTINLMIMKEPGLPDVVAISSSVK